MKETKLYGWFGWFLGLGLGLGLGVIVYTLNFGVLWDSKSCSFWFVSKSFIVDSVSWYLLLLTFFIWFGVYVCSFSLGVYSCVLLKLSIFSGLLCYISKNVIYFWVFYEISIICLLILVVVDSSYSERYLAFWVFLTYIIFSGLPCLLCILYLSWLKGSFYLSDWSLLDYATTSSEEAVVFSVLCVLFLSKIPLFPFHGWLPLVHSEASTLVSACLSGYIMKLGFLGLVRFKLSVFSDYYIAICLFFSVVFFIYSFFEMDMKRWLAFISLAHASIGLVLLSFMGLGSNYSCFYYAFGHGVSACVTFLLFGLCQCSSSTRNWLLVRRWLWGSKYVFLLFVIILLVMGSVPPTLQFFSEVEVIKVLVGNSKLCLLFMLLLVFFGKVSPLMVLGFVFSSPPRDWCIENSGSDGNLKMLSVLTFFCFALFFMFFLV